MTENLESKRDSEKGRLPDRPADASGGREARRRQIEEEMQTIASRREGSTIGDARRAKEEALAKKVSDIEADLGWPVSAESRRLMEEKNVDEPAEVAIDRERRLGELKAELVGIATADAIESMLPVGDPRVKELLEKYDGKEPLVYGSPEDGVEMVGVTHTNDPESPMAKRVQEETDNYLAGVKTEEALFMVEGMHGMPELSGPKIDKMLEGVKTREEAIKKHGEKGALLWEAKVKGIAVESPERDQNEIASELVAEGFTKDEIAQYLTIRQLTSEIKASDKPFDKAKEELEFAKTAFAIDQTSGAGWVDAESARLAAAAAKDHDLGALAKLSGKIIGSFVNSANMSMGGLPGMAGKNLIPSVEGMLRRNNEVPDDEKVNMAKVNEFIDQRGESSRVNEVARAWNQKRDEHVVKRIAAARSQGKKPLVLYGATHAAVLRDSVKALGDKEPAA